MIRHARAVSEVIPIMGFYLQPAVGGRVLPFAFWRQLAEIENLVAIKIAPFNRYQTFDVVRAVAESGRAGQVALYTGNDDNIIADLLTPYRINCNGRPVTLRIVGGLLGHWSVWTRRAVEQLEAIHRLLAGQPEPPDSPYAGMTLSDWLRQGIEITDANAAFFDAANGFAGCIAGLHEILRRQGLFEGRWCIDPHEDLSPGQCRRNRPRLLGLSAPQRRRLRRRPPRRLAGRMRRCSGSQRTSGGIVQPPCAASGPSVACRLRRL